jgi:iron complex transport system substrate-binding protein
MLNNQKNIWIIIAVAAFLLLLITACAPASEEHSAPENVEYIVIEDMWGRVVEVEKGAETAVIMEWEGLAAKSMKFFDIADGIVGIDDYAKKNPFRNHIVPELQEATDIGSAWSGINLEMLASLNPDVIFMELWITNESEEDLHMDAINKIEELGIPVVTFLSPSCLENPHISLAWEHIRLVGSVFDKNDEAEQLIERLEESIGLIKARTAEVSDDEKVDVAIFATYNSVMGTNSIQSYMLTEIVNANNVVDVNGQFIMISEEDLLSFDPEVLIVIGHGGYLDPELIYSGREAGGINWANVQDLQALKNKRMVSLGYEEWRATLETPVALLKIAKEIYPDLFTDIDIEEEEIKMYMNDYGLSREEALKAIEAQKYTAGMEVN